MRSEESFIFKSDFATISLDLLQVHFCLPEKMTVLDILEVQNGCRLSEVAKKVQELWSFVLN